MVMTLGEGYKKFNINGLFKINDRGTCNLFLFFFQKKIYTKRESYKYNILTYFKRRMVHRI